MSYIDCDYLLDTGFGNTCPPVGQGYEAEGLLINYDDVDWSQTFIGTEANGVPNTIPVIVLKTGKKAVAVTQKVNQPYSGSTSEMNAGTLRNTFNHNVHMLHLEDTPQAAATVDALSGGKFIVVLKNAQKTHSQFSGSLTHSNKYPVFGFVNGLRASAVTRDPYGEDNGGWDITLTESGSPFSGLFLWPEAGTDAAADAAYESLKTAAPGT